jgi:hypothetical protein
MYVGSLPAISNREDWQVAFTLVDANSGEIIDLAGCTVTMTVRDFKNKQTALTGSSTNGDITFPEPGTFMWEFRASRLSGLCAAQYEVGVRIAKDIRVTQLIVGTVDVMEGIDQQ